MTPRTWRISCTASPGPSCWSAIPTAGPSSPTPPPATARSRRWSTWTPSAPAQGQTLAQLLAAVPGSCAVPANLKVVPFPGAPSGVGDAYITQSAFPSCMANGLPAPEAQALAADQAPIATSALTQPSGVPAWKTIPSWAVVGTIDHAIPLALQLAMDENAHAHITEVKAPHLSMISDPGVVTSVILQAVRATT